MQLERLRIRLPTRTDDWRVTARAVRLVLSVPGYAAFALLTAILGLSVFVLSQNLALVRFVIVGGHLPLEHRLAVLVHLYPGIGTAFTPMSAVLLVASATLLGINFSMLAYHLREHRTGIRQGGFGSLAGTLFGTLGAGCAACGSAIFAGILSTVGAAGVLAVLPLDGLSFTVVALVMLLLSIYWLADGMRGGTINGCPVDV